MDLQEIISSQCKSMRQADFNKTSQSTLGEFILKLEAVEDKTNNIYFEFGGLNPTTFRSYRGYYDELALGFDQESSSMTVQELLDHSKSVIGQTFEGYKGGDFTMSKNTPIWAANYSHSSDTMIIDIVDKGWCVEIKTEQKD